MMMLLKTIVVQIKVLLLLIMMEMGRMTVYHVYLILLIIKASVLENHPVKTAAQVVSTLVIKQLFSLSNENY